MQVGMNQSVMSQNPSFGNKTQVIVNLSKTVEQLTAKGFTCVADAKTESVKVYDQGGKCIAALKPENKRELDILA